MSKIEPAILLRSQPGKPLVVWVEMEPTVEPALGTLPGKMEDAKAVGVNSFRTQTKVEEVLEDQGVLPGEQIVEDAATATAANKAERDCLIEYTDRVMGARQAPFDGAADQAARIAGGKRKRAAVAVEQKAAAPSPIAATESASRSVASAEEVKTARYIKMLEAHSLEQEGIIKRLEAGGRRQRQLTEETVRRVMLQLHEINESREKEMRRADLAEMQLKLGREKPRQEDGPGGLHYAGVGDFKVPTTPAAGRRVLPPGDWRNGMHEVDRRLVFIGMAHKLSFIFGTVGQVPPKAYVQAISKVESSAFNTAGNKEEYSQKIMLWLEGICAARKCE